MKTIQNLCVGLGMALTLAACSGGASGSEEQDLSLDIGVLGIGHDAVIEIAEDQGFYEAEELTVNPHVVANPPAALAALQSGQLDVAYTTLMAYFQALSQGVELQAVLGADGTGVPTESLSDPFALEQGGLYVHPDSGITQPAELEDRTVAVLARNGNSEVTIAAVVEADGGDASSINWVALDLSSALEALRNGNADAAGLVMPFTNAAVDAGMVQISAPSVEFFGHGVPTAFWVSTPSTIREKQDALDAFIVAQTRAADYANSNTEESLGVVKDVTGVDLEIEEMTPVHWATDIDADHLQEIAGQVFDLGYLESEIQIKDSVYAPQG